MQDVHNSKEKGRFIFISSFYLQIKMCWPLFPDTEKEMLGPIYSLSWIPKHKSADFLPICVAKKRKKRKKTNQTKNLMLGYMLISSWYNNMYFLLAGSFQPSHALMLKFYSYYKQATQGACNIPRPAFWDVIGKAKW